MKWTPTPTLTLTSSKMVEDGMKASLGLVGISPLDIDYFETDSGEKLRKLPFGNCRLKAILVTPENVLDRLVKQSVAIYKIVDDEGGNAHYPEIDSVFYHYTARMDVVQKIRERFGVSLDFHIPEDTYDGEILPFIERTKRYVRW